jgi:hypothetical protein
MGKPLWLPKNIAACGKNERGRHRDLPLPEGEKNSRQTGQYWQEQPSNQQRRHHGFLVDSAGSGR